jgi:hypothetical protein
MATSKINYPFISKLSILLFIVLFVYTSTSKLIGFEHFKWQLMQMPLLSNYAPYLAWGIPLVECAIVILFIFPKYVLQAFYASLGIITVFTGYIVWILNRSEDIPCSCGGVLSQLTWEAHLAFNLLFILLAIINILCLHKQHNLSEGSKNISSLNWD